MTVTAFRVQNFMGFEDSGWIELRPITLLFGRNSTGKSALIRALLLLRQSLESESDGGALLFVKDEGYDFGDYREIVRDHDVTRELSFWFRLQFYADKPDTDFNWFLKRALDGASYFTVPAHVEPENRPTNQTITVRLILGAITSGLTSLKAMDIFDGTGSIILRATKYNAEHQQQSQWLYASDFFEPNNLADPSTEVWSSVEIFSRNGFLPNIRLSQSALNRTEDTEEDEDSNKEVDVTLGMDYQNIWLILRGVRYSLRKILLEKINYLGPLRSAPQRFYYVAGQSISTPERGKHFVRNLVMADSSNIEAINEWLKTSGPPYQLQLQPLDERKTLYELRLQELSENQCGHVSSNIREVGFGITQMLPIITQAVLAQPGTTLIIEQPELHLHPRAQTELSNLFIAIAQKGVSCIIETHSEHLLLRMQKQIAKTTAGDIDPSQPGQMLLPAQVAVYFVNRRGASMVTEIEIGPYGDLLSTPDGFEDFFSDDMLETAERMRVRLGQKGRSN